MRLVEAISIQNYAVESNPSLQHAIVQLGRVLVQGQEFAPSPSSSFFFPWAREKTYGTNNGRFHQKPRHCKWASERTNSEETEQTREVFGPLVTPSSSYDLCFVSLFVFLSSVACISFFFLSYSGRTDFVTVTTGDEWWRRRLRGAVIMPLAGLKILLCMSTRTRVCCREKLVPKSKLYITPPRKF